MTKEQISYLESIGITGALMTKVEEVCNFYSNFSKIEIQDIFVSEFINKDGARNYENLWIFNDDVCCEAKFFLTAEDYDVDIVKGNIYFYNIKKTDFDIVAGAANDNSRLFLEAGIGDNRVINLKASRGNCIQAAMIISKYVLNNLTVKK